MVEDPKWELALLATVQSFYQRLLSDQLGGQLPSPAELAPEVISHTDDVRSTLDRMQLWIQLLDMAITPAMLRLGVQSDLDPEVAEALLRYFARHRDDSGANRRVLEHCIDALESCRPDRRRVGGGCERILFVDYVPDDLCAWT